MQHLTNLSEMPDIDLLELEVLFDVLIEWNRFDESISHSVLSQPFFFVGSNQPSCSSAPSDDPGRILRV